MITEDRLHNFLAFSTEVTAFTTFELWGTGQAEAYLAAVDTVVGVALADELFGAYERVLRETEGELPLKRKAGFRREIFGDEKLGPIARNIVKLWYVGTWYELPTTWTEAFGPAPKDVTFVVSPSAYVEGLMWKAIGAHPAGARAPGYGSWASRPQIPAFAGDPANGQPVDVSLTTDKGPGR
ncbi:hypothetical protein SAMN05216228_10735 [Rhizobium tibeticum]|uniref:Membrane bound FAD containing D-sorbitol dehydrogenase n=1 Tax=Rhizobium tibeticum TaxID=501024 RepID=A0ABY1AY11_9HYPH|nr:hypothetical protein [Rhizobium tibeticum]SEP29620.1 hypothetical protein SAMN05216228_10735 [Rhizobium tibeticum]